LASTLCGTARRRPERTSHDVEASHELRFGEERFRIEVVDGRFEVARGGAHRPDAILEGDSGTLVSLVYGDRELAEAARSRDLRLGDDTGAVERFLVLFPPPEPAAPAVGA